MARGSLDPLTLQVRLLTMRRVVAHPAADRTDARWVAPVKISRAAERDLGQVRSLLEAAELPTLPTDFPLSNLIVGLEGPLVIGAIGLEVSGLIGVLAFAAVAEGHARHGVGTSLVHALLSRANELGLRTIYLFTDRGREFFEKMGFVEIPRDAVPARLRSTRAFREASPTTAAFCLEIATRYM